MTSDYVSVSRDDLLTKSIGLSMCSNYLLIGTENSSAVSDDLYTVQFHLCKGADDLCRGLDGLFVARLASKEGKLK